MTNIDFAVVNEAYCTLIGPNPTDEQHDELVGLLADLWQKGMTAGQLISAMHDFLYLTAE